MNNVSSRTIKNLVCISFRSLLLYMFLMVNTGIVFAAGVTIDNIRFSTTDGEGRNAFLPGEEGLVHVDYTLDTESDTKVVVGGKVNGPKEVRGKWRRFLKKQKDIKKPGSNTESLSFIVDSNAIIGSDANVKINVRSGTKRASDQTTFSIVDTIPTPIPGVTPIITPDPAVPPTITPDPEVTPTTTPDLEVTPTPMGDPEPPVLESIGDKSIDVGDTLSFNITVADLNNDPLTFSVSPLPLLDNTAFNASTGLFTFSPASEQVGSSQLTFTVSDGALTDSETITITVNALPVEGDTALKGQLLDANDADIGITTLIVGATVTNIETGLSTTTDSNGNFTLGGLTPGLNHFNFDGSTASGPSGNTYGAFRGMQDIIANVTNIISRPVFLMRLEMEGEVEVDPANETVVENERLGVMIEIPPQTVMDDDGSLFTGMMSISEVPSEFTPASLPETLQLGLVITIQPTGLTFDQPVPITFPNVDNLIAGSQVDIWSLDHETGEFFISGTGEVSADATKINTISGGIRAASWHGPAPGATTIDISKGKPDCQCKKKDCKKKTGSETSVASGNLTIDHSLASYRSLDQSRTLRLVYNSDLADPRPIISSNVTNSLRTTVPVTISSSLSVAGVDQGVNVFTDTSSLNQSTDETIKQVLQFDASEFETGIYDYRMKHTSHYERSSVSSFSRDTVLVNNEKDSPFGSGWTLDGLARIWPQEDGNILLTDGDGSALRFEQVLVGFDLNTWAKEGPTEAQETWTVDSEGTSVLLSGRDIPKFLTFFVSPDNFINTTIRGTMKVETTSDDDLIGFVFGYQAPIATNGDENTDFDLLLFDWKQTTQLFEGSTAEEGFTLNRVSGSFNNFFDPFWRHEDSTEWEVLASDFSEEKGWIDNFEHEFELIYETDRIIISIDGNTIFDLSGIFPAGRLGFYSLSQLQVRYGINFIESAETRLQSPPGDFSTLVQNDDGSFIRTMKNGTKINFNTKGLQSSTVDINGNITTFAYDGSDNLSSITDPVGLVTTLTYSNGKLSGVKDTADRTTSFSVDTDGNLVSITDPDNSVRLFEYDSRHLLTGQTSKRGFLTTYTYGSFGEMILASLPDGATNQVTPGDTTGLVEPLSDEGSEENPAPVVRPEDVISILVDSKGNQTTFETNRFGASNMTTDALGRTTLVTRDDDSNPTRIEEPNGSISTMLYDDRGNLLTLKEAVDDNLERQTSFAYEPDFNKITRITDPAGEVTNFEYDDKSNIIKTTDPLGNENTFTYDTKGLMLTSTDAKGNTATFGYDANGNLASTTDALGDITNFNRNNAGNIISSTEGIASSEERTNSFTYDNLNRILTIVDGTSAIIKLSYDSAGNVEKVESPTGEVTAITYDERDRVISIDNPISGITQFEHDENGNLVKTTDALGNTAINEYDEADQLIKSIDALSGESMLEYDEQGNVVSLKDALGQTTTFTYDLLDHQIKRTNPLGLNNSFTYDSRGNLVTSTDQKGQVITNSYDTLSRLTESKTPDNTTLFVYDVVSNLVGIQDNDSSLAFVHDKLNRVLTSEVIDVGVQPGIILTNTYDSVGNRIQLDNSEGDTTRFSFDLADRITKVITPSGDSINLSNDLTGRLTQIMFPNNVVSDYQYDIKGRLEQLTHKDGGGVDLASFGYTYNEVGNILSIAELTKTRQFSYDFLQRLISGGAAGSLETYLYDTLGNRDTSHLSSAHTYDAANRLLDDDAFTYTYDNNGNLTTKTAKSGSKTTTFTWDTQNQLIQIDFSDATNATYRYDAFGRRIEKNVNGAIKRYVYDGLDILLEYDGTNTLMARYSHGDRIDQPLSMERNGQNFFYHVDNLGSIRKLTDTNGVAVNSYDYDSYGRLENNVEAVDNPFTYTGRELDPESELYYYRARYYNAQIGRFISTDPIGFNGGDVNLYRYVKGNPVNLIDPVGLDDLKPLDSKNALKKGNSIIAKVKAKTIKKPKGKPVGTKAGKAVQKTGKNQCPLDKKEVKPKSKKNKTTKFQPLGFEGTLLFFFGVPPDAINKFAPSIDDNDLKIKPSLELEKDDKENPDSVIPELKPIVTIA